MHAVSAPYVAPQQGLAAFRCPNCGVYAQQRWFTLMLLAVRDGRSGGQAAGWSAAECHHCSELSLWFDQGLVSPSSGSAPLPNADLPPDIKRDYEEACAIVDRSPRGAAALLRLAIQKLCVHLGQPGRKIDADIGALVAKGLPQSLQRAFDSVRVIGNEAVHPGTLDLRDNPELAAALFRLVNVIAEKMLTEPKEIDAIYGSLPASKLEGIAQRDGSQSRFT